MSTTRYPIVNRPLSAFKGTILCLGGSKEGDIDRLKNLFGIDHPEDVIYTVNIQDKEKPDMVADFCLADELSILPDARFDVVYFSHVCACGGIEQAIKNAYRLLKPEGILIYVGGILRLDSSSPTRVCLPFLVRNTEYVDFVEVLTEVGFRVVKEPRMYIENRLRTLQTRDAYYSSGRHLSLWESYRRVLLQYSNLGGYFIAYKNNTYPLTELNRLIPHLASVLQDTLLNPYYLIPYAIQCPDVLLAQIDREWVTAEEQQRNRAQTPANLFLFHSFFTRHRADTETRLQATRTTLSALERADVFRQRFYGR